jgi:hypothetical protein
MTPPVSFIGKYIIIGVFYFDAPGIPAALYKTAADSWNSFCLLMYAKK